MRVKMEKRWLVQLLVQCIIPNPDGRGQKHLMPVCVAQTVQEKDRQVRHRLPRWQSCQRRLPPRTAGCTASRHARPEGPPERHVGGCAGAWAQSGRLPRQAPCRCCYLVGSGSLPLTGPRGTLVGLPGKLLLPGPCLLGLNTLFLNGSKGTTEDLGGHPASLAAGCCDCPCTSSGY